VTCGRSLFSPDTQVSFTDKTDFHDIAEILLKVALNTITLTLIFTRYLMITNGKRLYYIFN